MDDKEFNTLADAMLARIDAALEASGADVDCPSRWTSFRLRN